MPSTYRLRFDDSFILTSVECPAREDAKCRIRHAESCVFLFEAWSGEHVVTGVIANSGTSREWTWHLIAAWTQAPWYGGTIDIPFRETREGFIVEVTIG